MPKEAIIGSTIFTALQDRLTPSEAILELSDNAADAKAKFICVIIEDDKLVFIDTGNGTDDPNKIMIPGEGDSINDALAIGGKRIGGKDAMACWGMKWMVQTVHRTDRKYHVHAVDWEDAIKQKRMIYQYSGEGDSSELAPIEIKGGGTIVTVSKRRKAGFPLYQLPALIKKLQIFYRPALRAGLRYSIRKDGKTYHLVDIGQNPAWFGPINEIDDDIDGMPFKIRYAELQTINGQKPPDGLSGLHIIYGPRVITHREQGSSIWIEVLLTGAWKHSLNSNKTGFTTYESELLTIVFARLKSWLAAMAKKPREVQSKIICARLAAHLARRFNKFTNPKLEKQHDGEFQSKAREPTEAPQQHHKHHPKKPSKRIRRRPAAIPGGNKGADLGPHTWRVNVDTDDFGTTKAPIVRVDVFLYNYELKILLNERNVAIKDIFARANSGDNNAEFALTLLVNQQLAAYLAKCLVKGNSPLAAQTIKAMTADGYEVDGSVDSDILASNIAGYLLSDVIDRPAFSVVQGSVAQ